MHRIGRKSIRKFKNLNGVRCQKKKTAQSFAQIQILRALRTRILHRLTITSPSYRNHQRPRTKESHLKARYSGDNIKVHTWYHRPELSRLYVRGTKAPWLEITNKPKPTVWLDCAYLASIGRLLETSPLSLFYASWRARQAAAASRSLRREHAQRISIVAVALQNVQGFYWSVRKPERTFQGLHRFRYSVSELKNFEKTKRTFEGFLSMQDNYVHTHEQN